MRESDVNDLLLSAGEAAFVVAQDGTIRLWNSAAEKLFGIPAHAALYHNCASVLHGKVPGDELICSPDCPVLAMARQGKTPADFDLETGVAPRRWVNLSTLVAQTPSKNLIIHLARDIDARKRLESVTRLFLEQVCALTGQQVEQLLASAPAPHSGLTDRERQILGLLTEGRSTAAIARSFAISTATVRNHVRNILQKLHAHSRAEAVSRSLREHIS